MKPAVAQVSSLHAAFEQDFEDFAAAHCSSIEVWLTKLETYLQHHSLEEAQAIIQGSGISVPVASFQGGILTSQGPARQEAWSLFRRRVELCQRLDIDTLIVAGDIRGPLQQEDLERAQVSLVEAAQFAGPRGVRLAFEFQASAAFANNLQTAAALVDEIGSPHLGLCLDVFHFYTGPSKLTDLGYLHAGNLFHVQFSDVADIPREFASDSDRILPGDGDIPLAPIIDRLRDIDYEGCVSVEVMNPQLWQVAPRQMGEIAITALRKLLGQAED